MLLDGDIGLKPELLSTCFAALGLLPGVDSLLLLQRPATPESLVAVGLLLYNRF